VLICDPNLPEVRITNKTSKKIEYFQSGMRPEVTVKRTLAASQSTNYVWQNLQQKEKEIILMIDGKSGEFSIDTIGELDSIKTKNDEYLVELKTTGYYKELEIRSKA
jgi:hypothetical protein